MPHGNYTITTPEGDEEHSAGGVVVRPSAAGHDVLLILRKRYGDWSLPKGHLEPGETHEQAALREVEEETGVAGRIVAPLGVIRYPITGRSGRPATKIVTHFLIAALDPAAVPSPQPGEVDTAEWVALSAAPDHLTWPGDQHMIALAVDHLSMV